LKWDELDEDEDNWKRIPGGREDEERTRICRRFDYMDVDDEERDGHRLKSMRYINYHIWAIRPNPEYYRIWYKHITPPFNWL